MLAVRVAAFASGGLRADFAAWRIAVVAYGAALLAVGAFGSLVGRGVQHFGGAGYCASLGWCAAAALAASAGPATADPATHTGYIWLSVCRNALILIAFHASFDGIASVSTAIADSLPVVATTAATACAGLIVIAAVTGAQAIRPSSQPGHDPRPHRAITVTACGAIALVSAVRPIVGPEVDVEVTTDAVVPLLALIVAAVLLAARPITDLYGQSPLFADVSSALRPSAAVTAAPIRTDQDRLSVADSHTSEAALARIARRRPDLRAAVAAHPNTRQGLLDWLAAQGDPEVTQAIVARHEG